MNITGINLAQVNRVKKNQNPSFGKFVIVYDKKFSEGDEDGFVFEKMAKLSSENRKNLDILQDKGIILKINVSQDRFYYDYQLFDKAGKRITARGTVSPSVGELKTDLNEMIQAGLDYQA